MSASCTALSTSRDARIDPNTHSGDLMALSKSSPTFDKEEEEEEDDDEAKNFRDRNRANASAHVFSTSSSVLVVGKNRQNASVSGIAHADARNAELSLCGDVAASSSSVTTATRHADAMLGCATRPLVIALTTP